MNRRERRKRGKDDDLEKTCLFVGLMYKYRQWYRWYRGRQVYVWSVDYLNRSGLMPNKI